MTSITPTASSTAAPWWLAGRLILRSGGTSAATMVGIFTFMQSNVIDGATNTDPEAGA